MAQRPLVVVSGTAHWGSRKLAEHHIAGQLTRYARVLFVDPPVSPVTLRRRPELEVAGRTRSPESVGEDLFLLSPMVLPGKDRAGIVRITDLQVRRTMNRAIAELGGELKATILTLPQRYLFDRRSPARRIYWAKDDHQAGAHLYGLDAARLGRSERRLVAAADDFLVCSDDLARTWQDRGADPIVFPNGCDAGHFAHSADLPRPPELDPDRRYAVFVGTLTERIDAASVLAVADRGGDVLLVGPPRRTSEWPELEILLEHPRVHHVGRRSYDELPAYLGASFVGLLPYRTDPYNAGSFPLKLLEYLAAGLPVVSTDLPAVRWLDAPEVQVASDAETFAYLVSRELARDRNEQRAESCQVFAAGHDWSRRAHDLAIRIGLAK